ncbi:FAD-dependent monooxygenase [Ramlibacter albus]|uniref:FAD-dependent monooxygenase n=1 Tax=Ramlibacter albus TaxID=2079448 RepID=A0A923S4G2_9BURK|nr:FAD-dependent monooxygenase [Ramlibacter albus]MBC5767436.1 FAD-dependent monooxygenase [Ramlibacter albus]
MGNELLIAGGGIGGLAAAVAATRAGWSARVFEQAQTFSEVGAGIQLGPNATRILRDWGLLEGPLAERVVHPQRLVVCDAVDGGALGGLRLDDFEARYGAPYLTVHRADLHAALFGTAVASGVPLHVATAVSSLLETGDCVRVTCPGRADAEGDALVGADGLWSTVRAHVAGSEAPRYTGHLAYRGLLPFAAGGAASAQVTAWLGPRMHMVTYPVAGGEFLNVVCIVEGPQPSGDARSWDHEGVREQLFSSLGRICSEVRRQLESVAQWRLWPLNGRPRVASAAQMAKGRVALLGDAAHPMLPYLAQGAGMAIEDARELQRVLSVADGRVIDVETALQRYALSRWQRCARVQARSLRNATIFHAGGPLRIARNLSMRVLGEKLLDLPWLYGH